MEKGKKLYYVTIAGDVYTYIITDITDEFIFVAWEEDTSVKTIFPIEQAKFLIKKCATLEDAQREARKR